MGARSWRRTWRQRPGARRLLHRPQALPGQVFHTIPSSPLEKGHQVEHGLFLPVCQLHLHLIDIAPAAILSVVALLAVERRHIAVSFASVGICSSTAWSGPSASCHGCKQVCRTRVSYCYAGATGSATNNKYSQPTHEVWGQQWSETLTGLEAQLLLTLDATCAHLSHHFGPYTNGTNECSACPPWHASVHSVALDNIYICKYT